MRNVFKSSRYFVRSILPVFGLCAILNVTLLGDSSVAANKKIPLPVASDVERATKVVNDLYHDDFKKAIASAAKIVLAQKLLQAGETEQSDMPGKYVLLKDAADQAAAGGDIATVDAAISDLANTFQFDPSKMTGDLARMAWKAMPPSAARVEFSQQLESMSDRALQDDHYDLLLFTRLTPVRSQLSAGRRLAADCLAASDSRSAVGWSPTRNLRTRATFADTFNRQQPPPLQFFGRSLASHSS